ncbi:MAG TPA: ribbon-helix-helix protein, CopG family [Actinomycetota bacterium]|nr:ribbon-helix-helix protein, CopG family [Actinomycetota bacterium]
MARAQTLVQLTDELLAALDQQAVATRRSRSDLIREAIDRYLTAEAAVEADRQIVEGYRRIPQEADPFGEAMARDSIAAEPW